MIIAYRADRRKAGQKRILNLARDPGLCYDRGDLNVRRSGKDLRTQKNFRRALPTRPGHPYESVNTT